MGALTSCLCSRVAALSEKELAALAAQTLPTFKAYVDAALTALEARVNAKIDAELAALVTKLTAAAPPEPLLAAAAAAAAPAGLTEKMKLANALRDIKETLLSIANTYAPASTSPPH